MESAVKKVRKVVDRRTLHYLRSRNARPKSGTLIRAAKALGISLPSPREVIELLRKKGVSYRKMSLDLYGDENHLVSFVNAYKYGHSLRFNTYKKLLDYAYEQGALKEKFNLDELVKVILGEAS